MRCCGTFGKRPAFAFFCPGSPTRADGSWRPGILDRAENLGLRGGFRVQVVHNDLNPHNILVDPEAPTPP